MAAGLRTRTATRARRAIAGPLSLCGSRRRARKGTSTVGNPTILQARLDRHLAAACVDIDLPIVGQRAQQVLQLARADGGGLAVLAGKIGDRRDLHLEIGGGDVQLVVLLFEQDVRENRQRVPGLNGV
jgi:hypothetical protein